MPDTVIPAMLRELADLHERWMLEVSERSENHLMGPTIMQVYRARATELEKELGQRRLGPSFEYVTELRDELSHYKKVVEAAKEWAAWRASYVVPLSVADFKLAAALALLPPDQGEVKS